MNNIKIRKLREIISLMTLGLMVMVFSLVFILFVYSVYDRYELNWIGITIILVFISGILQGCFLIGKFTNSLVRLIRKEIEK